MHREVFAEIEVASLQPDEDADAPVAVHVARELFPGAGNEPREPADRDVLSELGHQVRNDVRHVLGRPVVRRERPELRGIARPRLAESIVRRDLVGQPVREIPEVGGAGDEIGLAVHLEEDRRLRRDARDDEAFGRGAVRLSRGGGQPSLAEDLLGLLEVAGGLDERAPAVHHPDARLRAQIRHEFRTDFHDSLRTGSGSDRRPAGP